MPRVCRILVAGFALTVLGGIIASSTQPAVADESGQKTAANQKTTTAAGATAAKLAPSAATETLPAQADEKAIRATADEFVKAFNAADVKAIGDLGRLTPNTQTNRANRSKAAPRSNSYTPMCSSSTLVR